MTSGLVAVWFTFREQTGLPRATSHVPPGCCHGQTSKWQLSGKTLMLGDPWWFCASGSLANPNAIYLETQPCGNNACHQLC